MVLPPVCSQQRVETVEREQTLSIHSYQSTDMRVEVGENGKIPALTSCLACRPKSERG